MDFAKFEKLSLKQHPQLNEQWVQERIAEDPGILGLGDVILKDKERVQPRAGRLDLLLQDADSNRRFEVEVQLGSCDESHIIRTIEYWDIERKRYPQYEHTAVIVAEDITSRFLNVVSLFNGTIPLVAIQMSALKLDNKVGLIFTTVIDQLSLGLVDDDEETQEVTDRAYWENRANKKSVAVADELLELIKQVDEKFELKYNKFYIGLAIDGMANNGVVLRPRKNALRIDIKIQKSDDKTEMIETSGLDLIDYDSREGRYRIRLKHGEVAQYKDTLSHLILEAYNADNN